MFTNKPLIFIGDIHCNARAMSQIISCYPKEKYELIWLGDFFNSKKSTTTLKEIECVLYLMLEYCETILHSNHMHVLYHHLIHFLQRETAPNYDKIKGWQQTRQVIDALHFSDKKKLLDFLENHSRLTLPINTCERKIICAHAFPMIKLSHKNINLNLSNHAKCAIGITKTRNFWRKDTIMKAFTPYDHVIVGHHGIVTRYQKARICDLSGIQVPVLEYDTDTFRIFPL